MLVGRATCGLLRLYILMPLSTGVREGAHDLGPRGKALYARPILSPEACSLQPLCPP